jgi:hypothetical protein
MSAPSLKKTSCFAVVASLCAVGIASPGHTARSRAQHPAQIAEDGYSYHPHEKKYGEEEQDKTKKEDEEKKDEKKELEPQQQP